MKEVLQPGYGALLAQARQAMNLSVADVAAKLKLTPRQVEAIEAEDAAHLPGDIFLRGFVRNYARLVELNADDLITPLDAEETVSATITAPSEGVTISSGGLKRWVVIPLVLLIVFVAVVAVVYQWLRQGEEALVPEVAVETPTTLPATLPPSSPQTPVPVSPATPVEGPAAPPPEAAPAVKAPADEARAAPPVVAPVVEAVKPPVMPVESPKAEKPARSVSAPAGDHVLRFTASQDAWIQVVDGSGRRFSKLVRAGGSDSITGQPPFRLVVGEAAQVSLSYDGRAIDLTPFIGQKVARLTLE